MMSAEEARAPPASGTASSEDKQQAPGDSILGRKLKKILESDLETDSETAQALDELSTFFTDNSLHTRRFLRGEIERRSLQINKSFLSDLSEVVEAVESVHTSVSSMKNNCAEMRSTLDATKAKTRDLIAQTNRLREEGETLASQEKHLEAFVAKYQLTEAEEVALRTGDMGPAFYAALERSRTVHADCRQLLTTAAQQTTALGVMEHMSTLQEAALERLYRWTSSQCRSSQIECLAPEKSAMLSTAMRHLQDRPVMFKYVLDEYTASRRQLLVRSFVDALTVGGPGGTPRPIELHAHDPPRYVGDMLAWLHQSIPTESENLRTLLKCVDCVATKTDGFDLDQTCSEAVSAITDDVCRPLRTRVEQILLLEAGPVVLYKLVQLIRFYATTVRQQLHQQQQQPSSGLVTTLEDLEQLAYKQFIKVLQSTVQSQLARSTSDQRSLMAHDLAPTPSTAALLALLRETLSGSSVVDERPDQLQEIVSAIVDPLLESLQTVASPFPPTDRDVFFLNSLYQTHLTLALFQSNDALLASLASDMQLHLDTLASEQTSCLIANLGLQPVCGMVAEHQRNKEKSLAQMPGMGEASLREFLAKFDGFLVAPDVFLLPQTRLLVSSAHRKSVTRRSLEVVAASYAQLHAAVIAEDGGYGDDMKQLKTPEQVELLLQL